MPAELATSLTPADDAERLLQAESVVRDFCGWHIAPLREDVEFSAYRGHEDRLYLPTLLLVDVTAVTIDGVAQSLTLFDWDASGWLAPRSGCWPASWYGTRALTVTFDHGYATVPPSVTRAVQAIAQQGISNPSALRRIQAGPFVDEYASGGGGGGSIADALLPYVLPLV